MKVLLAGPFLTSGIADATGTELFDLPLGTAQTPIGPLSGALLKEGHDVHLVTLDPSVEKTVSFQRDRLQVTFCPLRGAPRFRARHRMVDLFAFEIAQLTEVIRRSDADIVHAHWTYEYAEAAIKAQRPHLVTMHDLGWDYLFKYRDFYRFTKLVMKYRLMHRVRDLTVVNEFMLPKLWQYGFRGRVDVVPNPIASTPCYFKDLDNPVIVTVGSRDKIKNVSASIDAFKEIQQSFPNAELHLFGPGLIDKFAGEGFRLDNVNFHGNVDHPILMDFLAKKATLLIHPSTLETFGVIIAEAKMRGVPAIAGSFAGGTVNVIGSAGILCDVSKPHEIADAALSILRDEVWYKNLQKESHQDAVSRFSATLVANLYIAIYNRILHSGLRNT